MRRRDGWRWLPGIQALRQAKTTGLELGRGGAEGGDHLACDKSGLAGELVDDGEPSADAVGRVDDDAHDRHATAQLPEGVAVGRMVAVVAPDAAQARGAGCAGPPQFPDEPAVGRVSVVVGLPTRVVPQALPPV